MVKEIPTEEEFDELLKDAGTKTVVVDFTATWCGPCKKIAPLFTKLSTENEGAIFVKVDVDDNAEISERYGVSAMPTFMAFKDGKKLGELTGAAEDKLTEFVEKHAKAAAENTTAQAPELNPTGGLPTDEDF
eukprot:CAMPEP_0181319238 /NCGR_PEP_ID=MMETSP1101-20121128/17460_1 /TAXON_ID=46948 /ORGANISM="Rhodomonas abbreviata, Strain Caron Lab Isolate" /LENGTH=131 /DNA_ID=CAMNT_0023426815 /DNA_START=22 /DNA_END=417 /DNA_ORIENTATION=+